ncbi:hypothetical protein OPKNFCMD_1003 [Methylobacterium crusticola]|uniref:Aspartyl beta-hydroxylase n=1 Tax=Methylobacterium crusticola TaxID=1697972 RepID=A0ABQ4QSH7_9HYPH|nr:aspartyl/asparaginyl beta-hydroxylase domain-containing protein [Methylobacterium crusticola]GJD48286.1 hypothetical protein OPKNFCMD_1003 [Methylobacterium crusticola]
MTRFPDRLRLPLAFDPAPLRADPAPLRADLACLAGDGAAGRIPHVVARNSDGAWSAIPLRGPAGATHPVMMSHADPAAFADTPLLGRCPAFAALLGAFACPLRAVRLMRLGPGSVIKEHRDRDLAYEEGHVRLHVPVLTGPGVAALDAAAAPAHPGVPARRAGGCVDCEGSA